MSLGVVLTSCYLFPFELIYLPGVNFKMLMAGLSIPLLLVKMARRSDSLIEKDILIIALFTLPITVFSLLANVVNGTNDYSFNYYFVSVFVWMGAGYFLVNVLKAIHGKVTMTLLINYLIAVCCVQCILAMVMQYFPSVQDTIDGMLGGKEMFMSDAGGRVHGIGCALDVAGGRFAAVLIMTAVIMGKVSSKEFLLLYLVAFILISVVGNMIGRTTTVGMIIALLYILLVLIKGRAAISSFGKTIMSVFVAASVMAAVLYNTNDLFRENLRFGFEGFFSLVEKGRWETNSNNTLVEHMIVFPDNPKTWLVGDGYGANPTENDPYYTGEKYHGFYKGTDIGYLRFIFFFGVFGMLSMIVFFAVMYSRCLSHHQGYKALLLMLLVLNYLIWFKVTTDLLPIFALFVILPVSDRDKVFINETPPNHPLPVQSRRDGEGAGE